jgi:F-type H+-transporting ATPase subunit a
MSAFLYRLSRFFFVFLLITGSGISAFGGGKDAQASGEELNVSDLIIHHVLDDHVWHFADGMVLNLPVIVWSKERGLDIFSSARFFDENHNLVPYNGYRLDHGDIYLESTNAKVLDLSITKNVGMLFINATLLLLVFTAVGKAYKRNPTGAPKGLQSFVEPVVLFIRDEIARPNIGAKYERYLPYLLTLFFFILFGNLIGLMPGAGNMTGNIAVTLVLAVFTFFFTNLSGNRHYWGHIFWTPGLPFLMRLIILPVEIVGIFTKPISLMVRLFVAITAGHIVLLCLIVLTFVFASYWVGFASTLIVLFISLIEILVAGIQAYVFTLFSALYIGQAVAEHEHH